MYEVGQKDLVHRLRLLPSVRLVSLAADVDGQLDRPVVYRAILLEKSARFVTGTDILFSFWLLSMGVLLYGAA